MKSTAGFTFVEVAVAGSLLAFSVLTAVAIIPQGLESLRRAKMKTVASATVVRLFARDQTLTTAPTTTFAQTVIASRLTAVPTSQVNDHLGDASGRIPDAVWLTVKSQLYCLKTSELSGLVDDTAKTEVNELASRLVFGFYRPSQQWTEKRLLYVWEATFDPRDPSKSGKLIELGIFPYHDSLSDAGNTL